MSRHSKWHKVRQFKGAIDAKRSASFTKLAREITVAAREKGGDPSMNVRLRVAIDRARKSSMPKDNIERAVLRGTGGGAEGALEQLMYEAYAPGGTALIVECLTDNRNRSANDVKHILSEHESSLAGSGAVTYLFDRKGVVRVTGQFLADAKEETELMFIDAGAEDIQEDEEGTDIICSTHDVGRIADAAASKNLTVESAEMQWLPKVTVETDEETAMNVAELINELEEHDDVQRVYSNIG